MDRAAHLTRLTSESPFDILIVGGGATGLGIAVDASARGLRVALIEADDFCKGTSSRSTKLVHGGVRYLKQGNVKLVRHALIERGRLLHNAPHLVHNLEFVIPSYSQCNRLFYAVGMQLYDRLAGRLGVGRSRLLSREDTLSRLPTVATKGLVGGVSYHDGQFDDARLGITLAQTAADKGAVLVNGCACVGLLHEGGKVAGVRVREAQSQAEFAVQAKVVINATGVFVDALRQLDEPQAKKMVAASQGIHLVLPKKFLPGASALMVPKTADGRVLFAVPWHDCLIVGTTDTPVPHILTEPRPLQEEYDFVMSHARKYLDTKPSDSDVLSVFAGLRPLVQSGGNGNTAALSRDHTIVMSRSGLVTITGGKWTTYRYMAEDLLNFLQKHHALEARPCPTREMLLHGAMPAPQAEKLGHLAVYGTDAQKIQALIAQTPSLGEKIHPELPYLHAEVLWQASAEMAHTVEAVLARRTRALLLNAKASAEAAPAVAAILAQALGKDETWQAAQCNDYRALAAGYAPLSSTTS